MAKKDDNVIDITLVEDEPQPQDDRPVHWADGAYEGMKMGKVDGLPSLSHFTRCGIQVGTDDPIRITDNPDNVTCEGCA